MVKWSNWSTRVQGNPGRISFARSEADVQALVAAANKANETVRVVGSGHSHYPLVPSNDVILDVSGFSGIIETDHGSNTVELWAGTKIYALGRPLHDAGFGLANQGDIDRQSIGGAVATGTHGTGLALPNLSAAVVGATIITSTGDLLEVGPNDQSALWQACRLNLGALGVVTRLKMGVRPAYKLAESGRLCSYEEIRADLDDLPSQHRHFEFFWFPDKDQVAAKMVDETQLDPVYPIADEGSRCGWNYEVLPNNRPVLHTEMEYSVPLSSGPECLDAIRSLVQHRFSDLVWPIEYRTVASDDVWLSTANGQSVATISVHQGIDADDEELFRACEEVFLGFGGKPHWGKVHYLGLSEMASLHANWNQWWAIRDEIDPSRTFVNEALEYLAP